ncbi:MAG TPA: inorganic pyrophosphatase, partial [Acidimicrobiaceae bacterium]|nr:inorganic pyrophosphatase [Acidimicrobiaceae bacterium]
VYKDLEPGSATEILGWTDASTAASVIEEATAQADR